jgi:hypothetical protein
MRSDPIRDAKSCSAVLMRLSSDWTVAAGGGRILPLVERSMGPVGIPSFHAEPRKTNLRAGYFYFARDTRFLRDAL